MNWRKIVVLAFLVGVAACHRKVSVNVPSPSSPVSPPAAAPVVTAAALRDADSAFEAGDFPRAAKSYETYLQSNLASEDKDRDRIVFQYGIAQSRSGVPALEAASNDVFNELIRDYPKSAYLPTARIILSLRADIERLRAESARSLENTVRLQQAQGVYDERIKQLGEELNRSRSDVARFQADVIRLQAEGRSREEKIKQLNEELDQLKKIDSGRRRTP